MSFKLTHHDKAFFHAEGAKGPFRISKKGLTKKQHERYLGLCNGGTVQKLSEGGTVKGALKDAGKTALGAVAGAVEAPLTIASGMIAAPLGDIYASGQHYLGGKPWSGEDGALAAGQRLTRAGTYQPKTEEGARTVGLTGDAMKFVLPIDAFAEQAGRIDPAVAGAVGAAAMLPFGPGGLARRAPAAFTAGKAATAAERAAAVAKARGATHATTLERLGMTDGAAAAETAAAKFAERAPHLDPAVLAAARAKVAGAAGRGGRTGVGLVPWDDMSLPEAQAAARDRAHLFQLDDGRYVGGPPNLKSGAALAALRKKIDNLVAKGAYGSNWYERARSAISEISNGDPVLADQLSQVLAIYSPQATPDTNFGWAIEQANRTALEGADKAALWAPKTQVQADKAARAFKGEAQDLGPKAGVYEQHINPNKAQEAQVRGVNDLWQGRIFGFPEVKDTVVGRGLAAKAGFSDAQHSFMTGENLQAALRAQEKGLLPAGVDPNVGNIQAATWVAQREAKIRADWAKRAKKAKEEGRKPPKALNNAEVKRKAAQSYDTVLDKYTASETYESVPGRGVQGHMSGVQDLPLSDRHLYTDETAWSPVGQHDPFYQALGMPSRPTQAGLGKFTSSTGVEDLNPNRAARPMVSYEPGRVPTFDDAGNPVTKLNSKGKKKPVTAKNERKGVNAPEEQMINQSNLIRSVIDAQEAGAWNAPRLSGGGKNAARVRFPAPLDEAATRKLYSQAKAAGLELIDTGGGTFTLAGPDFAGTSATDFGKALKGSKTTPGMGDALSGARVDRGSHQGNYQMLPWGAEGSGQVTQHLLDNLDPRVAAKLDASPTWRAKVGEKAGLDDALSARLGTGAPRADIQRLRGMISADGLMALKAHVAKYGTAGLPALIPFLLKEDSDREAQQSQQHAHGGTVQRFDAGGQVQPAMSFEEAALSTEGAPGYSLPPPMPAPAASVAPPGVVPAFDPLAALDPNAPPPPAPTIEQPVAAPAPTGPLWDKNGRTDVPLGVGLNAALGQGPVDPNPSAYSPYEAQQRGSAPAPVMAPRPAGEQALAQQPQPGFAPPTFGQPGPSAAQAYPPMPGIPGGGGGLSREIADATADAQFALSDKAQVEQKALNDLSTISQTGAVKLKELADEQERVRVHGEQVSVALEEEIKNTKIDPKHFFDSKSTFEKVLSGVGMLLSGVGSGLTGQPNMAMDVINRGIERDIDAQKANLSKKQNFLSYNLQKTSTLLSAIDLTRAGLMSVTAALIDSRTFAMKGDATGPQYRLEAQQLRQQAAQLRSQVSLQEIQAAQARYGLMVEQYKLRMLQQMTQADPSRHPANGGDNTDFLRVAARAGQVNEAAIGHEEVRVSTGKVDPVTGAEITAPKVVWRLYGSPEAAAKADTVFAAAGVMRGDIEGLRKLIQANPTGTHFWQDPEAAQAMNTHIAGIKINYERAIGAMQNQPSAGSLEEITNALGNPGGITDAVLGRSVAALNVIEQQLNDRIRVTRMGAHF